MSKTVPFDEKSPDQHSWKTQQEKMVTPLSSYNCLNETPVPTARRERGCLPMSASYPLEVLYSFRSLA